MLRMLQLSHLRLGIEGEIKSRVHAFAQIWDENKKEERVIASVASAGTTERIAARTRSRVLRAGSGTTVR
jgi:hypothetical protein